MCTTFLKQNFKYLQKIPVGRSYTIKSNDSNYDVAIVGGGIVGAATGREILLRNSNFKCAIIEKESALGKHQSSHNSGVIHAGIYYKPGSVKAQLCTKGADLLYKYLEKKGIPHKKVGKLIVATNKEEVKMLHILYERGKKNLVPDIRLIRGDDIKLLEPHCVGIEAIHSPHTGIVDFAVVTEHYGIDFIKLGGKIHSNFEVKSIRSSAESNDECQDINKYPIEIVSKTGKVIHASFVLACAGLFADKVAALSGASKEPAIIPFRGEYLMLKPEKRSLVNGNIYPVPDIRFPFLGVHFTPKLDGSVWLGPNVVLAFKREGYEYKDVSVTDLWDTVSYRGFHKVVSKYWSYGIQEQFKSLNLKRHVEELKKFIPTIRIDDVIRGPSGVRAQAVSPEGELIEDFIFDSGGSSARVIHCRNAPSPAATSSLAIGQQLADKVQQALRDA